VERIIVLSVGVGGVGEETGSGIWGARCGASCGAIINIITIRAASEVGSLKNWIRNSRGIVYNTTNCYE
jgi:hypothetical protein